MLLCATMVRKLINVQYKLINQNGDQDIRIAGEMIKAPKEVEWDVIQNTGEQFYKGSK